MCCNEDGINNVVNDVAQLYQKDAFVKVSIDTIQAPFSGIYHTPPTPPPHNTNKREREREEREHINVSSSNPNPIFLLADKN